RTALAATSPVLPGESAAPAPGPRDRCTPPASAGRRRLEVLPATVGNAQQPLPGPGAVPRRWVRLPPGPGVQPRLPAPADGAQRVPSSQAETLLPRESVAAGVCQ